MARRNDRVPVITRTSERPPRWERFVWQGALLIGIAVLTVTVSPGLATGLGILGGALLLAGLIGGATRS